MYRQRKFVGGVSILFSEVSSDKYFFEDLDNARKAFNYVLLHAIKNTNYDANRNKYIKRDNKSLRNYMALQPRCC